MKTLIAARSLWAAFLLVGGAGLVLSALNSSPAVIPEAGLGIVLMGFATVGAGIASAGRGTPSAGCSSPSLSGPRSTSWRGSTAHGFGWHLPGVMMVAGWSAGLGGLELAPGVDAIDSEPS